MPQEAVVIGESANDGFMHTNALDEVKNLRDQLLQQLDRTQIEIDDISAAIGVYAVPGTTGLG